jgi:hypothetical protein
LTIFGYNTDIRHGETVFHVQTEVRENDLAMQSAIFVRGRCIGKHTVSYAADAHRSEFSEGHIHELVTQQHRFVVNTIRQGGLDDLLKDEVPASPVCEQPAAELEAQKLTLEWLPDGVVWKADSVHMRFRVALDSQPAPGARLFARLDYLQGEPVYAEALSDADGSAQLLYDIQTTAVQPNTACTLLVKVTAGSQSVTRKFRLRSN